MTTPTQFPERNFAMFQIKSAIDWLIEAGFRPYVAINIAVDGLVAPVEFANRNGILILDLHGEAVNAFHMDYENNTISFTGSFKGVPTPVFIPVHAILSIYAKENPIVCIDLPGEPTSYTASVMSAADLPEEFKAILSSALGQGKPVIFSSLGDLDGLGEIGGLSNALSKKAKETITPAPDVVICSAESNRKANVRRSAFKVIDGGKGK